MEITGIERLLLRVAPILEELGIDYYITGGLAVSFWGKPRSTLDIDIVVRLIEPQVTPLVKAFEKISEFGYFDEDAAKEAVRRKGEVNFLDPESGYKVDFWISRGDERARLEYGRRVEKTIAGQRVYFISPEDLILNKLQWYQQSWSTRHLEDTNWVLKSLGKELDIKYLKLWAKKLQVLDILEGLGNF